MADLPPASASPRVERCVVKTVGSPWGKLHWWSDGLSVLRTSGVAALIGALTFLQQTIPTLDLGNYAIIGAMLCPIVGLIIKKFTDTQTTVVVDRPLDRSPS